MSVLEKAKGALAVPALYDFYQTAIGAPDCLRRFVSHYVKPVYGDRILDVGCGTGAVVPHLPPNIDLVGIDINKPYIDAARQRHGTSGDFRVADAADPLLDLGGPFDIAYASGVLHHVDDDAAQRLVAGALDRLKPSGRFISIDPTLVAGQGRLSRMIVNSDRGDFVRGPERITALFGAYSPILVVVTDMLRIPFAQVIMTIVKR